MRPLAVARKKVYTLMHPTIVAAPATAPPPGRPGPSLRGARGLPPQLMLPSLVGDPP